MRLETHSIKMLKNIGNTLSREDIEYNEQTTKHFLILPFLSALDYDVNDMSLLKHEHRLAELNRNVDKVDYALDLKDFMIIVEAKVLGTNLKRYYHQLQKYYNLTSKVCLGILTDGRYYHFFTDYNHKNLMDTEPFYVLDIMSLTDDDYEMLYQLSYSQISAKSIREVAETVIFKEKFIESFHRVVNELHPEFIKVVVRDFYSDVITKRVLERSISLAEELKLNQILQCKEYVSSNEPTVNSVLNNVVSFEEHSKKNTAKKFSEIESTSSQHNDYHYDLEVNYESDMNIEVDLFAFLLDSTGKCRKERDVIFFNNPVSDDNSVQLHDSVSHNRDRRVTKMTVRTDLIPSEIHSIQFVATTHNQHSKSHMMNHLNRLSISLKKAGSSDELFSTEIDCSSTYADTITFSRMIRSPEWTFEPIKRIHHSIVELCKEKGLDVTS